MLNNATLTQKTFQGAAWSVAGKLATQVVSVAGTLAVARLITPQVYGLVAMARLVIGLIDIFRDLGLTTAIIQHPVPTEELLSTAFWTNLALGTAVTGLSCIFAPVAASFYQQPQVASVIAVLSISFLITGGGTVHYALLSRAMNFKQVVQIETVMMTGSTIVLVLSAFLGAGVWSFVYSSLTSSAIGTTLLWRCVPWRPHWTFRRNELRHVAGYSLNLTGYQFVHYCSRNADNLIISRFLGATPLGYYGLAYNIMLYPVMGVAHVLGRVLFPAFAQIQNEEERFRQAYLKSTGMVSVVAVPLMFGLFVTAHSFVEVLLGPKWFPVAKLLQILTPVGLIQTLSATTGTIFFAKARTDWLFRWEAAATVCAVSAFCIGLQGGLNGVAAAYLLVNLLLSYPTFAIPFRLIQLPMSSFLHRIGPSVLASVLMALLTFGVSKVLTRNHVFSPGVHLAGMVVAGASSYTLLMLWWKPPAVRSLLQHGGWSTLREEVSR